MIEVIELEGLWPPPKREANGFERRELAEARPGRALGRGGRAGLLGRGGRGGRGSDVVCEDIMKEGSSDLARGSGGRPLRAAGRAMGIKRSWKTFVEGCMEERSVSVSLQ